MAVYAFDVDGTIETSAGPVTILQLARLLEQGHFVYIVSPSPLRPHGFPVVLPHGGGSRQENLRAVQQMHPDEDLFIYVSDNGDIGEAHAAGFVYVRHDEFG